MLNKRLILKKTYDSCLVKKPSLTVIFIHGIASDSNLTFAQALKYLAGTTSLREVRFVAFDLLGCEEKPKDKINYGYKAQLEALYNAIKKLDIKSPLVLVGHSMGSLIVTKYADTYKKSVKKLILISPPTYTEKDLDNANFKTEMENFKSNIEKKDGKYKNNRAFEEEIKDIVLNRNNYKRLANLKTPAVLIYSETDQAIMPKNIKKIINENPKYLSEITTIGTHRVARDKYDKIRYILEGVLYA